MPASKSVDIFLSLLAGMMARVELPQKRDKSQPSANGPTTPADITVVSPLLMRCPQQQAPVAEPPLGSGPGEWAGGAQNDIDQRLPTNVARAARDILNSPPAVQALVRVPDQRGEVAFAVRVVEVNPEVAPGVRPRADGASPAITIAGIRPEGTVGGERPCDARSPDASPSPPSDSRVVQSREATVFLAQTRAKGSSSGEADAASPAQAGEGSAAAPGDYSVPHSAVMPLRAQRTETSVPVTPQGAEIGSPHSQAAKEITVRLAADDSPAVDIRVIDRAGAVRIAVRTADTHLARSMQAGLSDLVNGLEHKGFTAEVWSPAGSASGSHDPDTGAHRQHSEQGRGAFEQSSGGQHHRHGHGENGKPDARHRPQWVSELASTIGQQEKEYRT